MPTIFCFMILQILTPLIWNVIHLQSCLVLLLLIRFLITLENLQTLNLPLQLNYCVDPGPELYLYCFGNCLRCFLLSKLFIFSSLLFFNDYSSRKTLIYLILTLNHMYPDYDFRYLCILFYSMFLMFFLLLYTRKHKTFLKRGSWVMPLSACWARWQPAI